MLVAGLLPTGTARAASTADALAGAQRELDRVQAEADEITARYEEAYTRQAVLENEAARLRDELAAKQSEVRGLRGAVHERAARAYKASGSLAFVPVLFEPDIIAAERRVRLLERANAEGNRALEALRAARDDLDVYHAELEGVLEDQRDAVRALRAAAIALEERLVAVQALRERLESQLAEELVAAAERERRARLARDAARHGGVPGADIICPIRGAVSFVDSWGAPRSGGRRHQGVDLMSPRGTPNVAVVSGTVSQREGVRSGLGVYLAGDDGNTYDYFHLSAYEGPPRAVEQGEVIGYTGDTGNARGGPPHTHFEYHPGGGAAVDPYPIVRPVC